MKIRSALFLSAASFALLACGGPPPVAVRLNTPPPPTVVVEGPRPAPVVVERKSVLLGLPLTGSQIDVLGDIEFDIDKATIRQTPQTVGILNTLANAGRVYPQITRLRVEGHTDSDGNEANNQNLSERRAQAVVQWLVEHGINPSRLVAVGCGSRDPLVPNDSPEHKQRNRRTEFDIEMVDGQPFEFATAACAPNPSRKPIR
jgi:outer membrane protein OmpA-like peptidoglycan-associated protein